MDQAKAFMTLYPNDNEPPVAMAEERVAALEALCHAATEGPWNAVHRDARNEQNDPSWDGDFLGWEIRPLDLPVRGQVIRGRDAQFMAEARTALPEALAEIRRLRQCLGRVADYAVLGGPAHDSILWSFVVGEALRCAWEE